LIDSYEWTTNIDLQPLHEGDFSPT